MRWRRRLLAVLLGMALLSPLEGRAGAAIIFNDWALTADGSAHYVLENNHFMVARCDRQNVCSHVINHYFPWYCRLTHIIPGDAQGTKLQFWISPPLEHPHGCISNGYSQFNGWAISTGGYSEGQNYWASWCVQQRTTYIFPRDPNNWNAYRTVIEVC